MNVTVEPRTAVVTGAAGGLGAAIAGALRARGVALVLVDIDGAALVALGARLGALTVVADIATEAGRQAVTDACAEAGLAADILVNAAAVERATEFGTLTGAEVVRTLEVNLFGAVLLTHRLLPGMLERRRGHVITLASLAGVKPIPFNALYNTTKAALISFSLSLSKELVGTGVHATVVCPAAVRDVGMWARASGGLAANRFVDGSTIGSADVVDAVLSALDRRPVRVLVASPLVRAGALLSSLSPRLDALMDRVSGLRSVYRQRIRTDRGNRL